MTSLATQELIGTSLHPGSGTGELLVLDEPLSFFGGVDEAGTITAVRHPQDRQSMVGRVVALPAARGSSSTASVLAELIRAGTAPAALLLVDLDTIMIVGALVAAELYGVELPVAHICRDTFDRLGAGVVRVDCGAIGERAVVSRVS